MLKFEVTKAWESAEKAIHFELHIYLLHFPYSSMSSSLARHRNSCDSVLLMSCSQEFQEFAHFKPTLEFIMNSQLNVDPQ